MAPHKQLEVHRKMKMLDLQHRKEMKHESWAYKFLVPRRSVSSVLKASSRRLLHIATEGEIAPPSILESS